MFYTKVEKINLTKSEITNQDLYWIKKEKEDNVNRFMRLRLNDFYNDDALSIENLWFHGVNGNIQGKRSVPVKTLDYILECTKKVSCLNEDEEYNDADLVDSIIINGIDNVGEVPFFLQNQSEALKGL